MAYEKNSWSPGTPIRSAGLNHIEDGIEESQRLTQEAAAELEETKADRVVTEELAVHIDRAEDRIGTLETDVAALQEQAVGDAASLKELYDTKADQNQLDGLAGHADLLEKGLADLDNRKAEENDLAALANESDRRYEEISDGLGGKADQFDNNLIAAEVDIIGERTAADHEDLAGLKHDISYVGAQADIAGQAVDYMKDRKEPTEENEMAALGANMIVLSAEVDTKIFAVNRNVNEALSAVADMHGSVTALQNGKVNKPSGNGTAGQVLATNGDGTTDWANPTLPTDEQIGEAVADWLDEHPEATTTIEDGAVTMEKLSSDVQEMITDNPELARYIDDNELYTGLLQNEQYATGSAERLADGKADDCELLLYQHASYYRDNDGFGFLFFTDPHNSGGMNDNDRNFNDTEPEMRFIGNIFERTPAKVVLCGGDWMEEELPMDVFLSRVGRVMNIMRREIGPDCYSAAGNHEYHETTDATKYLTPRELGRMWYGTDVCYFRVEKPECDIYVFDSWRSGMTIEREYWDDQVAWFASALRTNTKKHMFGMIHILLFAGEENQQWIGDQITRIAAAFNGRTSITVSGVTYDYSNATGTFHFFLAGHVHSDSNSVVNGIPVIRTRHQPTNIDLCYANFDSAVLHMTRIGLGSSRDISIVQNVQ